MNLFDHLKEVTEFKVGLDFNNSEVSKSYDPYMMNRYISMCEMYIPIVAELNKYNIPKDIQYMFYMNALPQRKHFFKYIKRKNDINKDEKRIIAKYYDVNINKVDEILTLISETAVQTILNKYRDNNGQLIEI